MIYRKGREGFLLTRYRRHVIEVRNRSKHMLPFHPHFRRHFIFVAPILAAISVATSASAVTFYTDRSTFEADLVALGITATEEGFEPGIDILDVNQLSFSNIDIINDGFGLGAVLNRRQGSLATQGDGFISLTANDTHPLAFEFASGVNGFGIDVVDALDVVNPGFILSLTTNNGDSQALLSSPLPDENLSFVGVIDTSASLSRIELSTNLDGDGMAFDRLTTGTVPEGGWSVTTLSIGVIGTFLLHGFCRRRSANESLRS